MNSRWKRICVFLLKAGICIVFLLYGLPARIAGDPLVASFDARIPTGDSARAEHFATFKLTRRGERLSGPVYAESKGFYFWLPSYARFRRSAPP